MPTTRIDFQNRHGQQLTARLELPIDGAPRAFALLAHCFTCSKDLRGLRRISNALAHAGLGVLRFDFTGLGESEGDFADTNFSSNVEDLLDAAAWLEREHLAPALLVGHSLGGAAVLMAAGSLPGVRAVATVGAPADPGHVAHLIDDSRAEIEARGEARVTLGGRSFTVRKQFLDDLDKHRMRDAIGSLKRPLLILHAPFDEIVGIDNAAEIFLAAKHPKSYLSLDDADHLLTRPADAAFVGETIATWSARYLPAEDRPSWYDDAHDNRIAVRTEDSLRSEAIVNGFALVVDEPVSVGGKGTGPTPYDYLATALAACTSMTLRLYADRKGWPLDAVTVEVRHDKVHVQDCNDCEENQGARIDRFQRSIRLEGALDDEQRVRLLEIADRCPVHRTLEGEVRIETSEAG